MSIVNLMTDAQPWTVAQIEKRGRKLFRAQIPDALEEDIARKVNLANAELYTMTADDNEALALINSAQAAVAGMVAQAKADALILDGVLLHEKEQAAVVKLTKTLNGRDAVEVYDYDGTGTDVLVETLPAQPSLDSGPLTESDGGRGTSPTIRGKLKTRIDACQAVLDGATADVTKWVNARATGVKPAA